MDIVFEPYTIATGQGHMVLPLQVRGADIVESGAVRLLLTIYGEGGQSASGTGSVALEVLRIFAAAAEGGRVLLPLEVSGSAGGLAPTIGVGNTGLLPLTVAGTGLAAASGDGAIHMPIGIFGSDSAGVGRVTTTTYVYGRDAAVSRVASLYQLPTVESFGSPGRTLGLADQFAADDAHAADYIHALMDLIRFSDSYSQLAQVLQALHDGIGMADVARLIWEAGLLDTFVASAVQAGTAQITVMLADAIDLSDTAGALSEILAGIRDGFYVTLTINTGDDVYTAWVMTPETKAMRSYTNWAFNSYATLGGQFLGAGPAGIYRMGGTTDDGVAIRSAIRTGLLNFGSQNMKAVSRAYIGATTTGNLLLRVQATTFDGRDVEQTYRLVPANTGAPRNHRVGVGRGFRSVYWTFELANDTSGADFEVTDWHVLPVTLSGRLI